MLHALGSLFQPCVKCPIYNKRRITRIPKVGLGHFKLRLSVICMTHLSGQRQINLVPCLSTPYGTVCHPVLKPYACKMTAFGS